MNKDMNLDWRLASIEERLDTYFPGDPTFGYPSNIRLEMIQNENQQQSESSLSLAVGVIAAHMSEVQVNVST